MSRNDASNDASGGNDRFETRAVHAGQEPDPQNGAIMTPVYFSSTFAQDGPAQPRQGYEYSRTANPTRTALERNLASLESGAWGLCFASGLAAINALCDRLTPGDHVVAGNDLYGGTYRIFTKVFERYGVGFTFVDASDLGAVEAAFTDRTRYLFLETPTNPLLGICDIAGGARLAQDRGALTVVDSTFATPFLQRPLELGADLVVHSLTKYLGGHSDVVGGAIVGDDDTLREELAFYQNAVGGQLGPMDAFLVLRGTKTLALRMERHCANARAVAEHLGRHPLVERVYFPGLPAHPGHEIATRQMSDFGGMVSFELRGGLAAARAFCRGTRIFTIAESLGGVESLVEVPALMTHASIPKEEREKAGLRDGLVRLSVGVEHVDDLIGDIDRALEAARVSDPATATR
ncbi:MAG: cystathionine gamma-synthase [Planctomycetota bacterium]|nr:cystathionine gamma-synthase [Planctomycetota bacterium]